MTKEHDEEEQICTLTPLGLVALQIGDQEARRVIDSIDLYCRRNNCGIAIHDNQLRFVTLTRVDQ